MKTIIKSSLIASMFALSLSANTIDDLSKQIDSLQLELSQLKSSQLDGDDELEERIDEIETAILIDKIKFTLEFRTRVDNFNFKTANGIVSHDNNIWSNRLRLNMKSKIDDNMKFNGRLTMNKNWSDSNLNNFANMDPMQARRPANSGIFVERAYVDWVITRDSIPIILTLGRQPSSDGPSHQFKDNTVRKSTYSALSFDGAADGIVLTMNLQEVSEVDGMAVRIGYGKGYQDHSNKSYLVNQNSIDDSNVLGLFFDTGLVQEGSLLQISAVSATDVVSNVEDSNKNIGDMMLYTAMLEFTNIVDSNLDIFAHYAVSKVKPNGISSENNGEKVGFLQNDSKSKKQLTGSAYWFGARYTMPIKSMNNPRIGLEYNHGNKNWFSFTQGSNDLTNKLATRGSATEVYYIQPINRYAHIRLGMQMIDYDYTGSGSQIGLPTKVSDTELDKLNNYYLQFNLAY